MSGRDICISIRVNSDFYDKLIKVSVEKSCSVSQLTRFAIENFFITKKVSDKLRKELDIFLIQNDKRKLASHLYIVKNMYKRILDMAMSSYFITGSINMKAINKILDFYVREFKLYDDETKKAIQIDFKMTVKRLRNENFLFGQSDNVKKLMWIGKR